MLEGFGAHLGLVEVDPSEVSPAGERRQVMYSVGELIFGRVGPILAEKGWAVFPQERDERRRPGTVDRRTLRIRDLQEAPPSVEDVKWWASQCGGLNCAAVMGPGSGNTFALDIDILEHGLADKVVALADEFFGYTPFRRTGTAPKIALIYRHDPEERIRNESRRFVKLVDGEVVASGDQIEILAKGKALTFYGYHHKTGRYFAWAGAQPLTHGPELAPLVSRSQLEDFLLAVQEVRAFYRSTSTTGDLSEVVWEKDESGFELPVITADDGIVENADGFVVDGRENFMFKLCYRIVEKNLKLAHLDETLTSKDQFKDVYSLLVSMAVQRFQDKAVMTGRWDTTSAVEKEAKSKIYGAIEFFRQNPHLLGGRRRQQVAEAAPLDSLNFIKSEFKASIEYGDDRAKEEKERALVPDRTEIAAEVQKNLVVALDDFFDQVYAEEAADASFIHVLKAPTGAGKTTRTIRYIAEDPRTKKFDKAVEAGEEHPGPLLFLLPTYHNIEELRTRAEVLNLDGSMTDKELAAAAAERGLIQEDELESKLEDLRRDAMGAGLRTMLYRGKIAAGCKLEEKVKMLMKAGIGTAGLCKAKVRDKSGETEEKYCVHYHECPAIQQRKQIAKSHVVFLPHAFLTLSIPEELKQVRAVIADERIFPLFVHTTTFMLSTLMRPRRKPKLSRKEKEEGLSPEDLLAERDEAGKIASDALMAKACPAQRLFAVSQGSRTGIDLVRSAKRVCGNAISANAAINPDMTDEEVADLCSMPTGTEVREEYRFWTIVEERILLLQEDAQNVRMAEQIGVDWVKKAKGDREMRLQLLIEENEAGTVTENIRLSWRSDPNWQLAPLMLLDASASPPIIAKIFGGRDVKVHEVPSDLNVRTVAVIDKTYSNVSIIASPKAMGKVKLDAARLKAKLQDAISRISSLYGWGRVVVGGSVSVRRALNTAWVAPSNVDYCHFGAMRGLDFAKNHTAAISIGRMEVPIRTVDGIVAALTYDDEVPEQPLDINGDGRSLDSKGGDLMLPLDIQVLPLREGGEAHIKVPYYPGVWARIVQAQYREEELRQFVGRLRPVYRSGEAPIWFAISKVIPDGIIVDRVINLSDLTTFHNSKGSPFKVNGAVENLSEMARVTDGVIHAELAEAAVPFLFEDNAKCMADMAVVGLRHDNGLCDLANRFTWGFTPVRISLDGAESFAFVRTEIGDPSDAVEKAFARFHHLALKVVAVGEPVRSRMVGSRRGTDWVDDEIGSMEDRLIEENALVTTVMNQAVQSLSAADFKADRKVVQGTLPVTVRAGEGDNNYRELASAFSNERMWARTLAGHDDAASSPVLELGANEYDHLADGARDGFDTPPLDPHEREAELDDDVLL